MARKYLSKLTSKLVPDKPLPDQINLKTMSLDDMVDLFADTKQMEAFGKKVNGYMKQALVARLPKGEDTIENENCIVTVTDTPGRVTLDGTRMQEDMGDNFMTKYEKTGDNFNTVKLTRK